jgi:trimethylamine:corrinoid methyltransferase-like protein
LFNRLKGNAWAAEGSKRLSEHLQEKTISTMDKHQPKLLADNIRKEIDYILKVG